MKYQQFLNTCRKFKPRPEILIYGLNNLSILPTQIYKSKKRELAFARLRSEVLVLVLQRLASCTVFAIFLENKSRSKQKEYTTFMNSWWVSLGKRCFQACATFLSFHAVFGDILSLLSIVLISSENTSVKGHFVTLIESGVHLVTNIWCCHEYMVTDVNWRLRTHKNRISLNQQNEVKHIHKHLD